MLLCNFCIAMFLHGADSIEGPQAFVRLIITFVWVPKGFFLHIVIFVWVQQAFVRVPQAFVRLILTFVWVQQAAVPSTRANIC